MHRLILKPGREKSLGRRHPWVFSGAVGRLEGSPSLGDTLEIRNAGGKFVAWGAFSPQSQIVARIWSWQEDEPIGRELIYREVQRAMTARVGLIRDTDGVRLVYGESDGLPGVIVDRYGETAVIQLLSAGAERWRAEIVDAVADLCGVNTIVERSDADVRELEGLQPRNEVVRGTLPTAGIFLTEHGLRFAVDIMHGHKTGFYLDQRLNRKRVGELCTGKDVLNCFCYTGGFSIHALSAGVRSITSVDSSQDALDLAQQNVRLNNLPEANAQWVADDVFKLLRRYRDEGKSFDLIILDPPKFAPTAGHAEKAARGYKDINLLAFKLLRPGGMLATFSCSGGVSEDLFQKIVAGAALDAGVSASIVGKMSQDGDHPVALNFPESGYLKGLLCHIST